MKTFAEIMAEERAQKPYDARRCPACDHVDGNKHDAKYVYTCVRCGAIFHNSGTLYLGDSYEYVLPLWDEEFPTGDTRYFDFTVLSSEGIERRHGWFNPATKKITQTG